MENFLLFLKGIIIGLFMLVPGISGGSIAIMLDLYDELLIRLNDLFKDCRKNFIFLFIVTLGGILGIVVSSFLLDFIITNFYFQLIYFFIGLTIMYFYKLIKNSKNHYVKSILYTIFGIIIGLGITMIPESVFDINNEIINLLLLGIFLAIALILPGISVSYVLLLFGLYSDVIIGIKTLDILFLFKVFIFLLIGIVVVIKLLNYLLINKKAILEYVIMGFIISSVWSVVPCIKNDKDLIGAFLFIMLGIIVKKSISK